MKRASKTSAGRSTSRVRRPAPGARRADPVEPLEGRVLFSTYVVTTTNDWAGTLVPGGTGRFYASTLRAAITAANAAPGADSVVFNTGVAGTVNLTTALPAISGTLTVTGPGAAKLTVRRAAAAATNFSVLAVAAGATAAVAGLTVAGGTGNAVAGNPAFPPGTTAGGGIVNAGTLALTGCTVTGNTASRRGGGLYNTGTATLTDCTIRGNAARAANPGGNPVDGGGIWNGGTLSVDRCVIAENAAESGGAGGLANEGNATLTRTTVQGNADFEAAGGVANGGRAVLALANCTVVGNRSGEGRAGGVANAGTATLTNCTVWANQTTTTEAGGIASDPAATLVLRNSIVAGNSVDYPGPSGAFESNFDAATIAAPGSGFNLIGVSLSPGTAGLVNGVNGNRVGVDPKLGPLLTEYGGSTPTLAPLPGSPAINAGSNALAVGPGGAPLATDQRGTGYARVAGGTVDIGAFEVQADRPPATYTVTTLGDGAGAVTRTGTNTFTATTLRAAIAAADAAAGADTVKFAAGLTGTINLASALPRIIDRLTLTGPGASKLTVRSTGTGFGAVRVGPGSTATLAGLTIGRGGVANDGGALALTNCTVSNDAGGGVDSSGTLTLAGTTVSGNAGRGLWNRGTATVTNSTVADNAGGGIGNTGTLALAGTTVARNATAGDEGGGGILNTGALTLTNSRVTDNTAGGSAAGGGILNGPVYDEEGHVTGAGTATLVDTVVSGNAATFGGGILGTGGAVVALTRCTVAGNAARHDPGDGVFRSGGGLYNEGSHLTLVDSTVSGNTSGDEGGGIYNDGGLTLTGTTVSGNSATRGGGGLANDGAAVVTRCTISENGVDWDTDGSGGGVANGAAGRLAMTNCTVFGNDGAGGIFNAGAATVTNCTVVGNRTREYDPYSAGGISAPFDGTGTAGTITLTNSIVAGNWVDYSGVHGSEESNVGAPLAPGSVSNLFGGGPGSDGPANVNGNLVVADPKLGPLLTEHGGPTATIAPLPGSPAINAGSNALAVGPGGTPLATDQRGPGYARVAGGTVDIGAFEVQADRPAATYTVTTLGDGAGTVTATGPNAFTATTLRAAIAAANAATGPDTVKLAAGLAGTVSLTAALPRVVDRLTLAGPGAAKLTVRRGSGGDYPVFSVAQGGTATLSGLTVSNGLRGIVNEGTLTVADAVVSGNAGGGIFNSGVFVNQETYVPATLTLTNSTVSGNSAGSVGVGGGGGVYNLGTLSMTNSTVSGNSAVGDGGGIYNGLVWGGSYGDEHPVGGGTLTLTNSTVSGNSADGRGGGIYNDTDFSSAVYATLTNSTITNNRADADADADLDPVGGGVYGAATANNTIVAGNYRGAGTTAEDVAGTLTGASNLIGGDPKLAPLADNGGPTKTHVPLPGSPAVDAGSNALAVGPGGAPLATDQRGAGFPRVAGGAVDVGAVERPAAGAVLTVTGTAGNDTISVTLDGPSLVVTRNGVATRRGASEFARVVLNGLGGDDTLTVARSVTLPATLDGGDGADRLHPGGGPADVIGGGGTDLADYADDTAGVSVSLDDLANDGPGRNQNVRGDVEIVLGGAGNDTLVGNGLPNLLAGNGGSDTLRGGGDRDVLIGGLGADRLFGDAADDLLIGSRTAYDGRFAHLRTLRYEWWNPANGYATRVGRLLAGVLEVRVSAGNVPNDGAADTLAGGPGRDWFVLGTPDLMSDRSADETATRF